MSERLLLLTFLFCLAILAHAQRSLMLTGPTRAQQHTIVEGRNVSVRTDDGPWVKGRLSIQNDSTIAVGGTVLRLDRITSVRVKAFKNRMLGVAWFGTGAVVGSAGILMLTAHGDGLTNHPNIKSALAVGGGVVTLVGVIGVISGTLMLVRGPQYEIDPRHRLVVR